MPTYEYKCTNSSCEHQFEIWQEVGSAPPECPECKSAVRKIFHPVSIHYKGSGFYITDSKSDGKKSAGKTEAKTETASEAKGEAKSDSSAEKTSSDSSTTTPAKTDAKPAADATASKSTATQT